MSCHAWQKDVAAKTINMEEEERFVHPQVCEAMNYVQEPVKPAFR